MRYFDYTKLNENKYDINIINLLARIHEAKGRQELYLSKKPQELERLVDIAKVQSVESSNAIENIRTTNTRIKQLVSQKTTPKNRDEEQIVGYRDVLNTIHESFDCIPLTPNYILQLHQILYSQVKNCNFAGRFKNTQNCIQGINEYGEPYVIFEPLAPYETGPAIESLCEAYNKAINESKVDSLILIPIFIHDFLCIHPFIDGNGRMSRLLTTLLLYQNGYNVIKYISLEALINKVKDGYYESLSESQHGWHEGKDDPTPFIKYMLSIIDMAYTNFEKRIELVSNKLSSGELVSKAFERKIGKIKKSDIVELCPTLSPSSVEKAIAKLVSIGKISKKGIGRSTYYIKKD